MGDEAQAAEIRRLTKTVMMLEKKLASCQEMRRNSEEIRDSQARLFEKVHRELEESRQLIVAQNREIESILRNIEQGILVIAADLKVGVQHSACIGRIIGRPPYPDELIERYLFEASSLSPDEIIRTTSALLTSIGEPTFIFECNSHQLATRFTKTVDGGPRTIEVDWNVIANDESVVERVIVILRDVTEIEGLRRAAAQKDADLRIIARMVDHDFQDIAAFLAGAGRLLAEVRRSAGGGAPAALDPLLRNLHTIKGNARVVGCTEVVELAHRAEAYLDEVWRGVSPWDEARLARDLDETQRTLADLHRILTEKLQFRRHGGARPAPLAEVVRPLIQSLPAIAAAVDKPVPRVHVDSRVQVADALRQALGNALTHCLRNSVDHGIDAPAARRARGLADYGNIFLGARIDGATLSLTVADDGPGLDLAALAARGRDAGLLGAAPEDAAVAELMFAPRISTKAVVTEISGRGVGMDAVRAEIRALGGTIRAEFTQPAAGGRRPFKLAIRVPAVGPGGEPWAWAEGE